MHQLHPNYSLSRLLRLKAKSVIIDFLPAEECAEEMGKRFFDPTKYLNAKSKTEKDSKVVERPQRRLVTSCKLQPNASHKTHIN